MDFRNNIARGQQAAAIIADLAIATVLALAPRDFKIKLCDECLEPVDFDVGMAVRR